MGKGNVYLGKTVKDTGKEGLDNLNEVRGIAKAILRDYKRRKISYRTAMSRMNLLSLVVTKDDDFKGAKLKRAKGIINKYRNKLKSMKKE